MTQTHVRNKLKKFNYPENRLAFKRQGNYCGKPLTRTKQNFHNNLNVKTIKPNFTDKTLKDKKIILVEDDEVITVETDLAKMFKHNFEK